MGVSQFPAAAGGGLPNDFILDKADSTNNTFTLPREFEAGGYGIVLGSGDTSFDVYFLNSAGSTVGYSNDASIVASEAFAEVVVLGVGTAETISFTYNGPSTDASAQGQETGAGAYLVSVTPSDLPQIDDTATVLGGNFASNVEFAFISGTVTKAAKNVVVGSSTAAVVTRPDDLIEDLAPYDLRAINPGVTPPTGSNSHILAGTITAGTDPSFVTTSPILGAFPGSAFSTAILTSDTEGSVVSWAITSGELPAGLTFGTADGSIAGTVAGTASGTFSFTVEITDDGSNTNSASFDLPVGLVMTGQNGTVVGGTTYVWFTSSDDLVLANAVGESAEYIVIAGGGGGGGTNGNYQASSGGGGAGGLLFGTATFSSDGTVAVTVGAGGAGGYNTVAPNGSNSVLTAYATAIGGGGGGNGSPTNPSSGAAGGSGGGGGAALNGGTNGGSGTAGQGFAGGNAGTGRNSGGGGGAGEAGSTDGTSQGGDGLNYGSWATAIGIIEDGGFFAGGGGGDTDAPGDGGGGNSFGSGVANTGGGGGGGYGAAAETTGGAGGSGLVILRKA